MTHAIIISVFNQKGGVGKTTTAVNLAANLANFHHARTLLVDLDPQANATTSLLGREAFMDEVTSLQLLLDSDEGSITQLTPTRIDRLSICPADIFLSEAETELVGRLGRETILDDRLKEIRGSYDFIIIDCQPSLGLLPVNALAASDWVIVPLEPQALSLKSVLPLLETIDLVRNKIHPGLRVIGLLVTKFYKVSRANRENLESIRDGLGKSQHVFSTIIPRDVRAEEAPGRGIPLLLHDQRSPACRAYIRFTEEVMDRVRAHKGAPRPSKATATQAPNEYPRRS